MKTSTNKLNQAIERMSSGYKVNHAKDNAANYSISTNMSTKISAYEIAESNTMMGLYMLSTANESLTLIEDKLMRLRALATQANNGTYGAQSLEAINTEANALTDEIERLYKTAEYNGEKLFNKTTYDKAEHFSQAKPTGFIAETASTVTPIAKEEYGGFIDVAQKYNKAYVDNLKPLMEEGDSFTRNEYKIAKVQDLEKLAALIDNGVDTTGITFILANDIDLTTYCESLMSSGGWDPIGDATNQFKGTFDGNGHSIVGLKISRSSDYQGFFGYTGENAKISNLAIKNADIKGNQYCGILAGYGLKTDITNCFSDGEVISSSSNSCVGGLLGSLITGCVTNCYSMSELKSKYCVGGLIGSSQYSTINNCYTTGNITFSTGGSGGIIGSDYRSEIKDSYSSVDISCIAANNGGLIGLISNSTVSNCYSTGNVNNLDTSIGNYEGNKFTGGFIGNIQGSTIQDCYSTGDVNAIFDGVGGFSGAIQYSSNINNCYATGNVNGRARIGGFAASSEASNITNCYATGNVTGESNIGGFLYLIRQTSGAGDYTNNAFYGNVSGNSEVASFVSSITNSNDGTTFNSVDISGAEVLNQNLDLINGVSWYDGTSYIALPDYDLSEYSKNIKQISLRSIETNLQVGINSSDSSNIKMNTNFILDLGDLRSNKLNVNMLDNYIQLISNKQTELGATQNRLESALDEISTQYENLVSSRSTIRDADMAELSSTYIQQQILQDASATLMATSQNLRAESLLGLIQSLS